MQKRSNIRKNQKTNLKQNKFIKVLWYICHPQILRYTNLFVILCGAHNLPRVISVPERAYGLEIYENYEL